MFVVKCRHCGGSFEADDSDRGKMADCPDCGIVIPVIPDTLEYCPDCGSLISRRAVSCPHCGSPGRAADVLPHNVSTSNVVPSRQIAKLYTPKLAVYASAGCFIGAIFAWGINDKASAFFSCFMICLFGIIFSRLKRCKCKNCNYEGKPELKSAPNGCAFILLLCLGILPGLIYLFIIPSRYSCPNCGVDAR